MTRHRSCAWSTGRITTYKKLLGFVSKYALNLIVEELDRVKSVEFDKNRCDGCTLTCTHGLPCVCQLVSFGVASIPLKSVHVMWTQLSFEDITTQQCSSKLPIDKEFEVITKRFKELVVQFHLQIYCGQHIVIQPPNLGQHTILAGYKFIHK